MFERRSRYFAKLFKQLSIGFHQEPTGRIDNHRVLTFRNESMRLYFNEATEDRPAYFAANKSFYQGFRSDHWAEVRNARSEPDHHKWMPPLGEEELALGELLNFVTQSHSPAR